MKKMFISHEELTSSSKQKCNHHILLCGTSPNICMTWSRGQMETHIPIAKILESYKSQ